MYDLRSNKGRYKVFLDVAFATRESLNICVEWLFLFSFIIILIHAMY